MNDAPTDAPTGDWRAVWRTALAKREVVLLGPIGLVGLVIAGLVALGGRDFAAGLLLTLFGALTAVFAFRFVEAERVGNGVSFESSWGGLGGSGGGWRAPPALVHGVLTVAFAVLAAAIFSVGFADRPAAPPKKADEPAVAVRTTTTTVAAPSVVDGVVAEHGAEKPASAEPSAQPPPHPGGR